MRSNLGCKLLFFWSTTNLGYIVSKIYRRRYIAGEFKIITGIVILDKVVIKRTLLSDIVSDKLISSYNISKYNLYISSLFSSENTARLFFPSNEQEN